LVATVAVFRTGDLVDDAARAAGGWLPGGASALLGGPRVRPGRRRRARLDAGEWPEQLDHPGLL